MWFISELQGGILTLFLLEETLPIISHTITGKFSGSNWEAGLYHTRERVYTEQQHFFLV